MKRWYLALALFGMLCLATLGRADYLLLVINVGETPSSNAGNGSAQPGRPGMGGGIFGMQGGPGMGIMGAAGGPGGPGMGIMGAAGGPGGPGMGIMGAAGGPGGPGGPGMGFMGAAGGPGGLGMGMKGGPGMGMMGGRPGAPGFQGGQAATPATPHLKLIPMVIELNQLNYKYQQVKAYELKKLSALPVTHQWGKVTLMHADGPISMAAIYNKSGVLFPNTSRRFSEQYKQYIQEKQPKAEETLKIAEAALSHGFLDKFESIMDKFVETEKANPIAVNYSKIKADLARPVERGPSAPWFTKLAADAKREDSAAHYAILYKLNGETDRPEIKLRAQFLENHLKCFFYWWALHNLVLPVPQEKLPVLVTGNEDDFKHYQKSVTGGPTVCDGYYSPRANLVVMALAPRNSQFEMLSEFSKQYFDQPSMPGMTQGALLKGLARPRSPADVETISQGGLLALGLRTMEHRRAITTISHDASRQLLYASGMFSTHVTLPEWLVFGMSSVFQTSPQVPWLTLGAPNPEFLFLLAKLKNDNEFKQGADVIRRIVSDGYFRHAIAHPKDEAERNKAEATAWALCFHLARKEPARLKRYFEELARMPRDLELDEDVLIACFARAMDAWDNDRKVVDDRKLADLASRMVNDMSSLFTIVEGMELLQASQQCVEEVAKSLNNGGGTTQPGGPRGQPGPGR